MIDRKNANFDDLSEDFVRELTEALENEILVGTEGEDGHYKYCYGIKPFKRSFVDEDENLIFKVEAINSHF